MLVSHFVALEACLVLLKSNFFFEDSCLMEHQSQVPKVGTWGSAENVSNTAHVHSARNGKKGNKINQNDPQETVEVEVKHDVNRLTSSPLHYVNEEQRTTSNLTHHQYGDTPTKVGYDRSIEQSPLHPQSQARIGRKGSAVSSPSWNRKGTSEGSHGTAPSTPGRSRLRSVTRGDETPDESPAVPKFGDWDDTDPAAAEGYSGIFTRVREERQSGGGRVPVMPTETSYSNVQRRYGNENQKGCWCFPWGKR